MKFQLASTSMVMAASPPSRGAWIEIESVARLRISRGWPPSRGAWIEIRFLSAKGSSVSVAPLAGGVD